MRKTRFYTILALAVSLALLLAACGATPTPTATPVPPTATKPPAPTNTTAPAPAAPTATKAPAAPAPTNTAVPPTAVPPTATKAAPAPTPIPPPAPAATGKTMVIGSATMPQDLNPFRMPGGQWMRMFRFTLVRLVNLDENSNFLPELAEKWSTSADGKDYTFNLRKDVLWSDGTKLTAKDVATTFLLHCTKDSGSNRISILKVIEGCQDLYDGKATTVSGIKTPDEYTVVLRVSSFNPGFLYTMPDVPIVPDAIFGKMAAKDIATSDYVLKGAQLVAGPFSVKQFTPNEWIEFVANPKYFRGAPKLAGIIEKKIPDRNTRLLAFEKGEVDYITDGLSAEYDRMMKLPGITAIPYLGTIQALWINYHTDKPNKADPKYVAMATKEFRQALWYAIDFEGYRNIDTGGKPDLLVPRNCFWTSGIFGFGTCDPTLNQYKYDPEKAKALLAQIKWDPKWEIDFAPYGLTPSPGQEALQQMWSKVGLNIKLRGTDPATFIVEMYEKGNFDITVLGLGGNANMVDFYYRFRTGNIYNSQTCATCYNLMRYGNAEFDKLVTQASQVADPKVFEPLMKQMTKIWNDDLPLIPYGQGKAFLLLGPKVDGKTVSIGNAYNWDDPHLWSMK